MTPESRRVRLELIDALYQQAQPGVVAVGGSLGAGLFAAIQWSLQPHPTVLIWLGLHLLVFAQATVGDALYRRRPKAEQDPVTWGRRFALSFSLSGAMWGAAAVLFFRANDPLGTAFLMVFFAGMGVVCVVAFSANAAAFLGYTVMTSVPLATMLFFGGTASYRVMGVGQLIYMGLTIVAAQRLQAVLVRAAELRFRNEDMAAHLRLEKERAEGAALAKTRFLAAASHDLRQPLHALSLFAELLDGRVTDPQSRVFLERIHASSHALEGLLNSLLDLSRIDSDALRVRRAHLSLSVLFDQLEAEFLERAERKGLTFTVRPCTLVVDSDFELLGRVLRNLLANAVRYTATGGVVLEGRVAGPQRVIISVSDTGRGIAPVDQPRVFEEFFRAEPRREEADQGLGLGLSIVRGLCRALGHPVTLVAQPERAIGTELIIELPLGDPALVRTPAAVMVPTAPGVLAGRLVLVIDDEPAIRTAMAALLESWHCAPLCAGSLDEARALLVDAGRPPDAVVCDHRLSHGESGTHVLAQLEAHLGTSLPAVMVTGDTSPERIHELKGSGRTLLFKPVMPGKLRAALTALLTPEP